MINLLLFYYRARDGSEKEKFMQHFMVTAYNYQRPFDNPEIALSCCDNLIKCHEMKRVRIHAFCLMPNHLHLCMEKGDDDPEHFLGRWKSFVTHESWKYGWSGKLWCDRHMAKKVNSPTATEIVISYVLFNPQKAKLVKLWKEWPYWAEPVFGKKGWK
ncbi:MAG: transposase [Fibrobacterota bacterium]